MKRLTRAELAERLTPLPPSDAFWSRAIAAERAVIGVASEAVDGEDERARANRRRRGEPAPDGPLSTGDIIDVGEDAFVVVAVEETPSGGRRYRIELIEERA